MARLLCASHAGLVRCRGMRILLLHFTLQYLFAIIFVSFQITDHPQDRPTDEENFRARVRDRQHPFFGG